MRLGKYGVVSVAVACICASVLAHDAAGPAETVSPLLQQPIANLPGKTFTSVTVNFPPGARAEPHRHGDAFVYADVLAGSVRSQLNDEPAKVYRTGDNWFEAPGAHHKVTENTSGTEPARLLVVFVSTTGAPLKTLDPH